MKTNFTFDHILGESAHIFARKFPILFIFAALNTTIAYLSSTSMGLWISSLCQMIAGILLHIIIISTAYAEMTDRKGLGGKEMTTVIDRNAPKILLTAIIANLAVTLGMLMLFIPGYILSCLLLAAVPASMFEQLGPVESMRRSLELTKSQHAPVFAAYGIFYALYLLVSLLLGNSLLMYALSSLLMAYSCIMDMRIYAGLREVKENIPPENLLRRG